MFLIIMIAGILLIAAGIFAIVKLPGIRLKYLYITILTGVLIFAVGAALFFHYPKKGILSEGEAADTGDDDTSGGRAAEGDMDITPGVIVVYGEDIFAEGKNLGGIAGLDAYIMSSERSGGYELVDKYAVYGTYLEVKKILENRGKEIISERVEE